MWDGFVWNDDMFLSTTEHKLMQVLQLELFWAWVEVSCGGDDDCVVVVDGGRFKVDEESQLVVVFNSGGARISVVMCGRC